MDEAEQVADAKGGRSHRALCRKLHIFVQEMFMEINAG